MTRPGETSSHCHAIEYNQLGALFRFIIMLEPTPMTEGLARAPVSVLLVDDQPANLLSLEAILEPLCLNLVRATSGQEALQKLLDQDFAAILLDVRMPDMHGFVIAELVRSRDRSRNTPIIFCTAYESAETSAEKAYSLGAVDYLVKPLVPQIVRAKVAGLVQLFEKTERVKQQAEMLRQIEREKYEQRLAEESIRHSEQRFRALTEKGSDGIALMSVEGTLTYATNSIARILGYPPEECVGRIALDFVHSEDHERVVAALTGLKQRPSKSSTFESRIQHKDGSWRWVECVATNMLHDPAVRAIVFNFRDISDRKRLETELRDRAAKLIEADRRKDEFLAMLAHELRNPLAPLAHVTELLRKENTPETIGRLREIIERQVTHMSRLVNDLLDVSRIARGRIKLRKERVLLSDIVSRAVETVRPTADTKYQALRIRLTERAIWLEADVARLEQVVTNLLQNAIKFTQEGGNIEIAAEQQGSELILRVTDDGAGISPELLAGIFDAFTQADTSLDRSAGGLGLGLTLVKRLIELHGGRVQARSDGIGQGSEFVVRLPVATAPTEPKVDRTTRTSTVHRPLKVLVVEDNLDSAQTLAAMVATWGHDVRIAHDGLEALTIAREYQPHLILLDIGLPKLNGYEVAERLREELSLGRAIVVAVTGYGSEHDRARSRAAGFDDHLIKPVQPAVLRELFSEVYPYNDPERH